jgi:hypothetical protein
MVNVKETHKPIRGDSWLLLCVALGVLFWASIYWALKMI